MRNDLTSPSSSHPVNKKNYIGINGFSFMHILKGSTLLISSRIIVYAEKFRKKLSLPWDIMYISRLVGY
jgi:hypothetical protein